MGLRRRGPIVRHERLSNTHPKTSDLQESKEFATRSGGEFGRWQNIKPLLQRGLQAALTT